MTQMPACWPSGRVSTYETIRLGFESVLRHGCYVCCPFLMDGRAQGLLGKTSFLKN